MNKTLAILLVLLCTGCSKSLDSLDGPSAGSVSGFVCHQLPMLTAANEMPASRDALVAQGHCLYLNKTQRVDIVRTVMMPGDGKYSQFELALAGKQQKLWIETTKVRS